MTSTITRIGAAALAGAMLLPIADASAAVDFPHTGKKFAAYRYDWYPLAWKYTFETAHFPSAWRRSGPGTLGQQHGMLVLDSTSHGSVAATLHRRAHKYGRWELRLRTKRLKGDGGADYTAHFELVPGASPTAHCGGRSIDVASYVPGRSATRFAIHSLPNHLFTAQRKLDHQDGYWHTYGVEVTKRWISWFVDGRVRATERNPEARSGVAYTPRLELSAPSASARMHPTRLMIDTIRHFSLKHGRRDTSRKSPADRTATYC